MRFYVYAALVAAALALVAYAGSKTYTAVYQAGADACEARHARAADAAAAEVSRKEQVSSDVSNSMLEYLAANLPPIEQSAYAARERIRVVYREHPVPAVCHFDERVRSELSAARDRANAAGGMRVGPSGPDPAGS